MAKVTIRFPGLGKNEEQTLDLAGFKGGVLARWAGKVARLSVAPRHPTRISPAGVVVQERNGDHNAGVELKARSVQHFLYDLHGGYVRACILKSDALRFFNPFQAWNAKHWIIGDLDALLLPSGLALQVPARFLLPFPILQARDKERLPILLQLHDDGGAPWHWRWRLLRRWPDDRPEAAPVEAWVDDRLFPAMGEGLKGFPVVEGTVDRGEDPATPLYLPGDWNRVPAPSEKKAGWDFSIPLRRGSFRLGGWAEAPSPSAGELAAPAPGIVLRPQFLDVGFRKGQGTATATYAFREREDPKSDVAADPPRPKIELTVESENDHPRDGSQPYCLAGNLPDVHLEPLPPVGPDTVPPAPPRLWLRTERGWLHLRAREPGVKDLHPAWGSARYSTETRAAALHPFVGRPGGERFRVHLLLDNSGTKTATFSVPVTHPEDDSMDRVPVRITVECPAFQVVTGRHAGAGRLHGAGGREDPDLPPHPLAKDGGGDLCRPLELVSTHLVGTGGRTRPFSARLVLEPPAGPLQRFALHLGGGTAVHWRGVEGLPLAAPLAWSTNDPTAASRPSPLRGLLPIRLDPPADAREPWRLTPGAGGLDLSEGTARARHLVDPTAEGRDVEACIGADTDLAGWEVRPHAHPPDEEGLPALLWVRHGVPALDASFQEKIGPGGPQGNGLAGRLSRPMAATAYGRGGRHLSLEGVTEGFVADRWRERWTALVAPAVTPEHVKDRTAEVEDLIAASVAESTEVLRLQYPTGPDGKASPANAVLRLHGHPRGTDEGVPRRFSLEPVPGTTAPTLFGLTVVARGLGATAVQHGKPRIYDLLLESPDSKDDGSRWHLMLRIQVPTLAPEKPADHATLVEGPLKGTLALSGKRLVKAYKTAGGGTPADGPRCLDRVESATLSLVQVEGSLRLRAEGLVAVLDVGGEPVRVATNQALEVWAGKDDALTVQLHPETGNGAILAVEGEKLSISLVHPLPPLPALGLKEEYGAGDGAPTLALACGSTLVTQIPPAAVRRVGRRLYLTGALETGEGHLTKDGKGVELLLGYGLQVTRLSRFHLVLDRDPKDGRFRLVGGFAGWTAGNFCGLAPAKEGNEFPGVTGAAAGGDRAHVSFEKPMGPSARSTLSLSGWWHGGAGPIQVEDEGWHHQLGLLAWDSRVDLEVGANGVVGPRKGTALHLLVHHRVAPTVPKASKYCSMEWFATQSTPWTKQGLDLGGDFALSAPLEDPRVGRMLKRRPGIVVTETAGPAPMVVLHVRLPAPVPRPEGASNPVLPYEKDDIEADDVPQPETSATAPEDLADVPRPWNGAAVVDSSKWGSVSPHRANLPPSVYGKLETRPTEGEADKAKLLRAHTLYRRGPEGPNQSYAWVFCPVGKVSAPPADPEDSACLWVLDDEGFRRLASLDPLPKGKDGADAESHRAERMLAALRWRGPAVLHRHDDKGKVLWELVDSPLPAPVEALDAVLSAGSPGGRAWAWTPDPALARPAPEMAPETAGEDPKLVLTDVRSSADLAPRPTGPWIPPFLAGHLEEQADALGAEPSPDTRALTVLERRFPFQVDERTGDGTADRAAFDLGAPWWGVPLADDAPSGKGKKALARLHRRTVLSFYTPRPGELARLGVSACLLKKDAGTWRVRPSPELSFMVRTPRSRDGQEKLVTQVDHPAADAAPGSDGCLAVPVRWTREHPERIPVDDPRRPVALALHQPGCPVAAQDAPISLWTWVHPAHLWKLWSKREKKYGWLFLHFKPEEGANHPGSARSEAGEVPFTREFYVLLARLAADAVEVETNPKQAQVTVLLARPVPPPLGNYRVTLRLWEGDAPNLSVSLLCADNAPLAGPGEDVSDDWMPPSRRVVTVVAEALETPPGAVSILRTRVPGGQEMEPRRLVAYGPPTPGPWEPWLEAPTGERRHVRWKKFGEWTDRVAPTHLEQGLRYDVVTIAPDGSAARASGRSKREGE